MMTGKNGGGIGFVLEAWGLVVIGAKASLHRHLMHRIGESLSLLKRLRTDLHEASERHSTPPPFSTPTAVPA